MSNNQQTVEEAINALGIAFRNLSEAINLSIKKNVVSENRIQLLKTTSENNLLLSKDILKIVSETLDMSIDIMISKNRTQHIVDARAIYFYLVKKVLKVEISFSDLGMILKRDHATVIYSVNKAEDLIFSDKAFEAKVNKCINAYNLVFTDK